MFILYKCVISLGESSTPIPRIEKGGAVGVEGREKRENFHHTEKGRFVSTNEQEK